MKRTKIAAGLLLLGACVAAAAEQPATQTTPEIILPSKQDDSRQAASREVPRELLPLTSLTASLVAWFPMDSTDRGCLRWSRKPMVVKASSKITIRTGEGRVYADFNANGARISFEPPLELGRRYTLAGWVQTPVPQNHGSVWCGSAGEQLYVQKQSLEHWNVAARKSGTYAKTAAPLTGWHHLAVTSDGNKTLAYLNGTPLDPVQGSLSKDLSTIGNNNSAQHQHWMMTAGLDEHFIFDKPLTVEEIKRLMQFSRPKN